jgi:hypothetical protein
MTVRLPKRVFKHWREISAESYKVSVDLLLTSRLDPTAATDILSQSVEKVLRDFEAAHPLDGTYAEGEPPFVGQWDVAPVPEGALLVGGYKSDAFEEIVQSIADELFRRGVRGKLDLYARPDVPWEPSGIGTVEARVRVLGRRVSNGGDRWAAERAALDRVIEAATRWCIQARPDRGVALYGTAVPHLPLRRCDRPLERLRQVIRDDNSVRLASIGHERFRRMVVESRYGSVTVLEGGPILHRAGWHPSRAAAVDFLRLVGDDVVYGFVRRVPPSGAHERLRRSRLDATAHEDHLVPDAFPIQLLGPGYAGRVPAGDDWRATALSEDRVLLEHVDPAAWFDELTLEEALAGESMPRHVVVERARASFTDLLFQDITDEERSRTRARLSRLDRHARRRGAGVLTRPRRDRRRHRPPHELAVTASSRSTPTHGGPARGGPTGPGG